MNRPLDAAGSLPTVVPGDEGAESVDAAGPTGPRRRTGWRDGWAPWILLGVVLVVALAIGTPDGGGPATNAERTYQLSRQVKCPECVGQSVAESDVVISREIRRDIAARVEAGETDQQILDAYAARYGRDILLEPPTSGAGAVVWWLPVVALAVAVGVLVAVFRRWRRQTPASASDDDRALVARALHDDSAGP